MKRLPLTSLIAYGLGGAGVQLMASSVQTLVPPVFNVGYALNPGGVALVLAAPLLWELFFNPFIGAQSDRAMHAGRQRRVYLLLGTIAGVLSFAAIWWTPRGPAVLTYGWLVVVTLVFRTAVSTFAVPYAALGYDLSSDYHERTRIAGVRSACSFVVRPLLAWLIPLCHLAWFTDVVEGARWVGLGTALVIAACCLPSALIALEPAAAGGKAPRPAPPPDRPEEKKPNWWKEFTSTFANRPFALLMLCSLLKSVALGFTTHLGLYVLTYYAFQGEWQKGAMLGALIASGYHLACAGAAPLMVALSHRIGKKLALLAGLACAIGGTLLKWPLYHNDPSWWLALVPLLMAPGVAGVDLVLGSMLADVCDHDELSAGRRRSGVFAGAALWVGRAGTSLALILAGQLLNWSGFDPLHAAQSEGTLQAMRLAVSILPAALLALAALCVATYPLSRARVEEIQGALAAEREKATDRLKGAPSCRA